MIKKPTTPEEYISGFPAPVQEKLNEMRRIIKKAAPDAEETISYGLPAYKTHGFPLVYFGGFKSHIGFYATPSGHSEFSKELSAYKEGKGPVQFPLDIKLPADLISRIVKFRLQENKARSVKNS